MAKPLGRVLIFVMMGFLLEDARGQCQSHANLIPCACNIMGACDAQGNPLPGLDDKLTGYSPSGVEQFGKLIGRGVRNLAYLCEDGVMAILYDCENRIPLYSATVMNEIQLNAGYQRPNVGFKQSPSLDKLFQANDADYVGSSDVRICYQQHPNTGSALIDSNWYRALNPGKAMKPLQNCPTQREASEIRPAKRARSPINTNTGKLSTSIHKGHLIAAQYGRGDRERVLATFTYTNTIPQFGSVNSGSWNKKEHALIIKWGQEFCAKHKGSNTKNARMYITVGAIPSSLVHLNRERYFGKKGFANYQSNDFRINVPIATWTAACCTFQFKDSTGNDKDGTSHTFFALKNEPRVDLPADPINFFNSYIKSPIVLFPGKRDCNDKANYIKLY